MLGIAKAYATRVGGGPFPTELDDKIGQGIRDRGVEYGASTGRPRRCGWMDIVALKRAVAINGITGLCITKLDVLDGMDKLKICIAYEYHDKRSEYAPLDAQGWEECTQCTWNFQAGMRARMALLRGRNSSSSPRLSVCAGRAGWLSDWYREHWPETESTRSCCMILLLDFLVIQGRRIYWE